MNHITRSPCYQQYNGLGEKNFQIVKNLFYKAKEEDKDLFKCLMIYHNDPLTSSLKSLIQILQSRSTRSDPGMSKAARHQLGLQSEELGKVDKHEHFPIHDYHIGQDVMFQDVTSKQWYSATLTSLCSESRCYKLLPEKDTSPFEALSTIKQEIRR